MEKYYCEHCRNLFDQEHPCIFCGCTTMKKIRIEVQYQGKRENSCES